MPTIYSTWLDIAQLIVTIVGLAFVVLGLRQTKRSIDASTYQHILTREAENWRQVRSSSKIVKVNALRHFGLNVTEDTSDAEIELYLDRIGLFDFYEGIYFLNRQDALDRLVWSNWSRSLGYTMANAEIRTVWESVKDVYNPEFRLFVESLSISSSAENLR